MNKEIDIDDLVLSAANEILENNQLIKLDDFFTGPESSIESIDIVQIISLVEDKIAEQGYEGFDIFDKVFEKESLKFKDLSKVIKELLNN